MRHCFHVLFPNLYLEGPKALFVSIKENVVERFVMMPKQGYGPKEPAKQSIQWKRKGRWLDCVFRNSRHKLSDSYDDKWRRLFHVLRPFSHLVVWLMLYLSSALAKWFWGLRKVYVVFMSNILFYMAKGFKMSIHNSRPWPVNQSPVFTKWTCMKLCIATETSMHPFGCLGYGVWLSMTLIQRNREKIMLQCRLPQAVKVTRPLNISMTSKNLGSIL